MVLPGTTAPAVVRDAIKSKPAMTLIVVVVVMMGAN